MTDVKISTFFLQLLDIIEKHNDFTYTGKRNLKKQVMEWGDSWFYNLDANQSVLNLKDLTSELLDELKYDLARTLSTTLAEESCTFDLQKHKISAKMVSVRRKAKE